METDGGTLFNKEAVEGKSDNAEEGEKDEVDEETGCGDKKEGGIYEETGVSPARWWVLAIFSLLGMVQCMLWNTWGPVRTLVF